MVLPNSIDLTTNKLSVETLSGISRVDIARRKDHHQGIKAAKVTVNFIVEKNCDYSNFYYQRQRFEEKLNLSVTEITCLKSISQIGGNK